MSDDLTTAHARARQLVGEMVWEKLSENARANAVKDEMRGLGTDTAPSDSVSTPSIGSIGSTDPQTEASAGSAPDLPRENQCE
jgi:hypothetical protein